MDFQSHAALQLARSRVSAKNLHFGSQNGKPLTVFLDAGKTRSELRPALITHRAAEVIVDLEKAQATPLEVVKDMRGKTVKCGGNRCGYSLQGTWQFTPWARSRYSADELDMASAFANMY